MTDDPYEILGVDKDATPEQINAAYRAKARKEHPDAGGSTEKFTRVKNASMVLLDPKMRERFDRTGKLEEPEADNRHAKIMEMIANFFISTIDAMDDPRAPSIDTVDLVVVAKEHFKGQIDGANNHAQRIGVKVKRYKRALKRLKCKKQDDVVTKMISHHISINENLIKATHFERDMFKDVLTILDNYSFEPGQGMLTPTQQQNERYNNVFDKGFFS